MEIIQTPGELKNGTIVASLTPVEIFDTVANRRNILIVKDVFPPSLCIELREEVFLFGRDEVRHSVSYPGRSFHRIDHLNPESATKHVFHAFNFDYPDPSLPPRLSELLGRVFEPIRDFQQAVSFRPLPKEMNQKEGLRLHPQILHYPKGGGFFDYHLHPFEPQRVGLILNLAKRGKDYHSGGTSYRYDGKTINIGEAHDQGDIAIFRYDILHAAETVDPGSEVDFNSMAGKWSAILPYY